jgi:radical SAM/Cys-rich protein
MSETSTGIEFRLEPFDHNLSRRGLELKRSTTQVLQINVGLLCDLACRHCHLEAGPSRLEIMSRDTMNAIIDYASRVHFATIDITGGAPELAPDIRYFITRLAQKTSKLIVRTNLVALQSEQAADLITLYKKLRVTLVASLPSTDVSQTDAQRGAGVWEKSIRTLKELNNTGYGMHGTGLELDLVANPIGAILPAEQHQTEMKFRRDLKKQGVIFTNLYTFANAPLGRFRAWLVQSGNLENYLEMLADRFSPDAVSGVMCRSQVSVSWDGYLYDCDFNIATGLHQGGVRRHIADLAGLPEEGAEISTGEHCYACTAGSGFT